MTRERRRRLIRRRRTAIGISTVAAISFLAGMTDAIGLLTAGNFVSFMSGNTTRAAVAVADGQWKNAIVLLSALVTFVMGNAFGAIIAHGANRRAFRVLTGVTLLLGLSALMTALDQPLTQFHLAILAMGLVNASVEHIEGLPIGLTYVTGALSRLGRGLGAWICGHRGTAWIIQTVPWTGMLSGAIAGAFLKQAYDGQAFWFACALSALIAIAVFFVPPRLQRRMASRPTFARRRRQASTDG